MEIPKSIPEVSVTGATVIPQGTAATVAIELPTALNKLSNAPLSGDYRIKCYQYGNDTAYLTNKIRFDQDPKWFI